MSAVTDLADTFFELLLERFPIGARAVPDDGLSPSDRITKRTIVHEAETMTAQIEGRYLEFTVSNMLLTPVAGLLAGLSDVPLSDDFPTRLAAVPEALETIAQRQRAGLADRLSPVAHLVQQTIEFLDGHLTTMDTFVRPEACRPVVTSAVAPAIKAHRLRHRLPRRRYIAAPGQALAYMVGRLEIQRLRRAAESRLGDRFDIRDFHEAVLGEGPVPLSVLAELIDEWVASV
jgi:uncharacterized protein (DUF885 family)